MTPHAEKVLRFMLTKPDNPTWARELTQHTNLPNGTLLPILIRLLNQGWVERYWEDDETAEAEGRPRRRYYRFTRDGAEEVRLLLAQRTASRPLNGTTPRPGLVPRPHVAGGGE